MGDGRLAGDGYLRGELEPLVQGEVCDVQLARAGNLVQGGVGDIQLVGGGELKLLVQNGMGH
jgi:hypothetical protein